LSDLIKPLQEFLLRIQYSSKNDLFKNSKEKPIMHIIFPNPYGYHPYPISEQVQSLQQQYAEFLIIQNGFDLDHLK